MRAVTAGTISARGLQRVGTFAVAVTAYACATAVGVIADANRWDSAFTIALGPLPLIDSQRHGETTSTLFGSGIMIISLALGVINGSLACRFRNSRSRKPLLLTPL